MIKTLTIVVATAGALYSGYWFVGASAVEDRATAAIEDLRSAGWDITFDDLSTSGFPNLFETTLTNPRLASPIGTPAWQSEVFTVYALSYRPNEIIALFPETQKVVLPDQVVTLSTSVMRASAKVAASLALPLDTVTVESGPFSASSSAGWEFVTDRILAAFRVSGVEENAYDLYFSLEAPSLDGISEPGLALDAITLDAQAVFDAPLDRHVAAPALLAITLRDARLAAGAASLVADGALTFDAAGLGNGEIMVTATDWATLIDTFEIAGLLAPEQATLYRTFAGGLSGGGPDFTAPITVADGIARWSVITLGSVRVASRR